MNKLSPDELSELLQSVFPRLPQDQRFAVLVDFPDEQVIDQPKWKERRDMAWYWVQQLKSLSETGFGNVDFIGYENVKSNNADLPEHAFVPSQNLPGDFAELSNGEKVSFEQVFQNYQVFLAPTQFSATAPLKVAAKKYGFRAATMPGFSAAMIPALRIDYGLVNERVTLVQKKLDAAESVKVRFSVDDNTVYDMNFDVRFRSAHASGGRFPDAGTAGNLPSGEAYIVPYEGENEKSLTSGLLPVQFNKEIVLFEILENKAVKVVSKGEESTKQQEWLEREPAYGNMAELGFGILGDFGLKPINEVLLDEKLGFHIAFGRSEHFGGIVGPPQFSGPDQVVHIDRIYIPETQPRIKIKTIELYYTDGNVEEIMRDSRYLLF